MKVIEDSDKLVANPLISILCITFNQEDYLSDALDSFLEQDISVPVEILVNDDCSTDGTRGVLMRYQEKRPDLFRIVTHETNQYSCGKSPMGEFLVPLARGKYIAMCEGDDYWTDPKKLSMQLEYLESHPELAACVHAHENVQAATKRCVATIRYSNKDCDISREDVVTHSQCYATNSLFVRTEAMCAYRESPFFALRTDGDHKMLVYFGLIAGGIHYINDVMSAYRVLAKNSVNRTMLLSGKLMQMAKTKHDQRVDLLHLADDMTQKQHHALILMGIDSMDYSYYRDIRDLKTLRKRWPERLKKESLLAHIDLYTYAYCKPLHKVLLAAYCRL